MIDLAVRSRLQALIALSLALIVFGSCASLDRRRTDARIEEYSRLLSDEFEQTDPERRCRVHKFATRACAVPVHDGMCVVPDRSYVEALLRYFPNSYWRVLSCSCVSLGDHNVIRHVCPACRAVERQWRARHRWPIDDEEMCW